MRLSQFILDNLPRILGEWEVFARSLPIGQVMTPALRNDAERMLRFVAADIESAQSAQEQADKGQGRAQPEAQASAAQAHGLPRHAAGFSLVDLVAEYRALRASVTRLWLTEAGAAPAQVQELVRFHEAIDQLVAESVSRLAAKLEQEREMALAMLGHDVRNPLNTVTMAVDVMRRWGALTPAQREVVQRISDACERMEGAIAKFDS